MINALKEIKLLLRIKEQKDSEFFLDLGEYSDYASSKISEYLKPVSEYFYEENKNDFEKIMNYVIENCPENRIKEDLKKSYSGLMPHLNVFNPQEAFFVLFSKYVNQLGDLILDDFLKENGEIPRCKKREDMIHYRLLNKLFGAENPKFSKFAENKAKNLENELLQGTSI
ncbi:MAG: hypothetical protein PHS81_01940 [Candidatus Nanoarchaeia archaeon]|nr:hypothetical protein [Candidatus Nanoarchaeia archaeon]